MRSNRTHKYSFIILFFFLTGCATNMRTSPGYDITIKKIKKITVLPPDIKVYKLTAGNIRELIDEWSSLAKKYVKDALEVYLGERHDFQISFVDEASFKSSREMSDAWLQNKALYEVIAQSALLHAYPGQHQFKTKVSSFDYSLGPDVRELNKDIGADAFLFVYGFDHESSAGRTALNIFNFLLGAAAGVSIIPVTPSGMIMSLVNAETGDLEWMNISPPNMEYSFRSKRHINGLIEWLTRNFVEKK